MSGTVRTGRPPIDGGRPPTARGRHAIVVLRNPVERACERWLRTRHLAPDTFDPVRAIEAAVDPAGTGGPVLAPGPVALSVYLTDDLRFNPPGLIANLLDALGLDGSAPIRAHLTTHPAWLEGMPRAEHAMIVDRLRDDVLRLQAIARRDLGHWLAVPFAWPSRART